MRGLKAVNGVSFSVRAGEVLGIAGVQGNGQTELAEALTGLRPIESGRFTLDGKDLTGKTPRLITESGLANIPEDRQRHGLVLSYSITDNMVLCDYYRPPFGKRGVIQQKDLDENAKKLIKEYDVRTPSPFVSAGKLSGGNQQKVIVARELSRRCQTCDRISTHAWPGRRLDRIYPQRDHSHARPRRGCPIDLRRTG